MSYQDHEVSVLLSVLLDKQSELTDARITLSEMDDKYEELESERDLLKAENKLLTTVIKKLEERLQTFLRGETK